VLARITNVIIEKLNIVRTRNVFFVLENVGFPFERFLYVRLGIRLQKDLAVRHCRMTVMMSV
jgi:hypothetical protein